MKFIFSVLVGLFAVFIILIWLFLCLSVCFREKISSEVKALQKEYIKDVRGPKAKKEQGIFALCVLRLKQSCSQRKENIFTEDIIFCY